MDVGQHFPSATPLTARGDYSSRNVTTSSVYNELCDGVSDVLSKAFTPMHLRDDPKIYTGRTVRGEGKTQRVPFKGQGIA